MTIIKIIVLDFIAEALHSVRDIRHLTLFVGNRSTTDSILRTSDNFPEDFTTELDFLRYLERMLKMVGNI